MSEEEYKEHIERLEKEADWLATWACVHAGGIGSVEWWRKLAHDMVAMDENRWKENWYTL